MVVRNVQIARLITELLDFVSHSILFNLAILCHMQQNRFLILGIFKANVAASDFFLD